MTEPIGATEWEYRIVVLPRFATPTSAPGASAAIESLNREGAEGWEAVGMTVLDEGVGVLLKRALR